MDYQLKDNCIILNKKLLKNDCFNNFFCNAINKLFSFEIDRPRILFNKSNEIFEAKLKHNCEVEIFCTLNKQLFFECVHNCEFDLGFWIEESKSNLLICLVSGSGQNLSDLKMSILENEMIIFKNIKKKYVKYEKNCKKIEKNQSKKEKSYICFKNLFILNVCKVKSSKEKLIKSLQEKEQKEKLETYIFKQKNS